jgi:hypothetical protein
MSDERQLSPAPDMTLRSDLQRCAKSGRVRHVTMRGLPECITAWETDAQNAKLTSEAKRGR